MTESYKRAIALAQSNYGNKRSHGMSLINYRGLIAAMLADEGCSSPVVCAGLLADFETDGVTEAMNIHTVVGRDASSIYDVLDQIRNDPEQHTRLRTKPGAASILVAEMIYDLETQPIFKNRVIFDRLDTFEKQILPFAIYRLRNRYRDAARKNGYKPALQSARDSR